MFAQGQIITQKVPLTNALGKIWRVVAQTENFVENLWITTLEEAGRLCKTIPQNGLKLHPWGAGASQSCPIDFYV